MLKHSTFLLVLLLGAWNLISSVSANPVPLDTPEISGAALGSRADDYYVVVTDQEAKEIRVYPRSAQVWNNDTLIWSYDPSRLKIITGWRKLTDVRIRKTAKHGLIAMIAAEDGGLAIVDIRAGRPRANIDDTLWRQLNGYAHSFERIPHNGAVVTTSGDAVSLYVQHDKKDVSNYAELRWKTRDFGCLPGASGLLWHPNGGNTQEEGLLYVLDKANLTSFKVVGKAADTTLKVHGTPVPLPGKVNLKTDAAYDIQPDYTNPEVLLISHSHGGYSFNTRTRKWTGLVQRSNMTSFTRQSNGEYLWVVSATGGTGGPYGDHVSFGMSPVQEDGQRSSPGLKLERARIFRADFQ